MKSVKWFYVGAMAIALGMLTFATVACHDDDDDPKPAEGEVVETPKPVVGVLHYGDGDFRRSSNGWGKGKSG